MSTEQQASVSSPATKSAGHVIVDTLESHGVQRVYTVPGESYLDVLDGLHLSLIHISEPTRLGMISYAVFCLKKKN